MKIWIESAAFVMLAACSSTTKPSGAAISYKISAEGSGATSGENGVMSGDQRYRIVAGSDVGRNYHLLIADIQMKVGGQIEETWEGATIPITDGVGSYTCHHMFFRKTDDDGSADPKPPICEFKLKGSVFPSREAIQKSQ